MDEVVVVGRIEVVVVVGSTEVVVVAGCTEVVVILPSVVANATLEYMIVFLLTILIL
jgi:hypothetical protein